MSREDFFVEKDLVELLRDNTAALKLANMIDVGREVASKITIY